MRKVKKSELDEIGKAFVKADAISTRELEKIVGDPALFDAVKTRIASDAVRLPQQRSRFRPMAAAFASVAVIAAVTLFAAVTLKRRPDIVAVPEVPVIPKTDTVTKSKEPDRVSDTKLPPAEVVTIKSERTTARPTIRQDRPRTPVAQQASYGDDFYAVSYAGDPNETERGGRIVRVDIPRSTLFAMGIDLPLENETETVKADLLIGNDGVTRAIRVVK